MNTLLVSLLFVALAVAAVNAAPNEEKKNEMSSESQVKSEGKSSNESSSSSESVNDSPFETSNESVNDSSASSTTLQQNFGEALTDLLRSIKRIMPCGEASLKIPVMAPFRLPQYQFDIDEEFLVFKGDAKNLIVDGLNDFILIELASNSSNNRTKFDILFKGLQIVGEFNISINADLAGFRFAQAFNGLMDVQVSSVRISGGVTIGKNKAGGMILSNMEYFVQVGDIIYNYLDPKYSVALNNFINQYLRDSSLIFLQTNQQFLGEKISKYATELGNKAFENISSNAYIEAMQNSTKKYDSIKCNF